MATGWRIILICFGVTLIAGSLDEGGSALSAFAGAVLIYFGSERPPKKPRRSLWTIQWWEYFERLRAVDGNRGDAMKQAMDRWPHEVDEIFQGYAVSGISGRVDDLETIVAHLDTGHRLRR